MSISEKNILFISSDMFDIKFLVKRIDLKDVKYNCCKTNKEAEVFLKKNHCELIILNYETMGFSKLRLINFIKEDDSLEMLPIIFLMGKESINKALDFLYQQSEDFLIKPFDPEIMKIKVQNALKKKAILDEIKRNLKSIEDRNNKEIYEEKLHIFKEISTNMANELKDPINFIKNFSEIAINNANSIKITSRDPEVIKENEILIENLIENLNTIYRYSVQINSSMRFLINQSSFKRGDIIKTKITSIIDSTFQINILKFKKYLKNQQIIYETNYDLWNQKITIDPVNIQKAISLIFDNAIEGIIDLDDDNSMHRIETETKFDAKSKTLKIIIRDNGVGIPRNVLPNIFKPFFTTKANHHGLGLATAKEIIEKLHNGVIEVASEINKFTEVTITLPTETLSSEENNNNQIDKKDKEEEDENQINDLTEKDEDEEDDEEEENEDEDINDEEEDESEEDDDDK